MSLAQGNNTPTRPRIEPGSPDPESEALTTRPVRPPEQDTFTSQRVLLIHRKRWLRPDMTEKNVDLDVKPQPKQTKQNFIIYMYKVIRTLYIIVDHRM